jgi:hypothetical protein
MMIIVGVLNGRGCSSSCHLGRAGLTRPAVSADGATDRDYPGVSVLLDNLTTVLLVAPVISRSAGSWCFGGAVTDHPLNIGGTAMLIGDPPDMIIAMRANLCSTTFDHLMPIVVVPVIDFIGLRVVQQRRRRPRVLDSPLDRGTAVCLCLPRIWRDLIAKYEPAQLRRCLEYSPS